MHTHRHRLAFAHRRGDQANPIAQIMGQLDIVQINLIDALNLGRGKIGCTAKGQSGQYGDLMGGIKPADIGGGIGLGITKPLGLGQDIGKGAALGLRLGQDIIAGASEDTGDADHVFANQGLTQHLDGGGAAHHGGLEQERHALGLGKRRQVCTMRGDQGLIGGYDRLTHGKRRLNGGLCRTVRAANQLDK